MGSIEGSHFLTLALTNSNSRSFPKLSYEHEFRFNAFENTFNSLFSKSSISRFSRISWMGHFTEKIGDEISKRKTEIVQFWGISRKMHIPSRAKYIFQILMGHFCWARIFLQFQSKTAWPWSETTRKNCLEKTYSSYSLETCLK